MKRQETRVTRKYQTTIPKEVRKSLDVRAGGKVTWHVVRNLVVVDVHRKVADPVMFLTSQTIMDQDATKLVKEARGDLA